jgi:antitoxin HigA-1
MRQHNPPHPGEFIQSVYLDPYADKISRSEIARKLGVARPTFNRLVNGQSNISPGTCQPHMDSHFKDNIDFT